MKTVLQIRLTVMKLTGGLLLIDVVGGKPMNFSQVSCPDCGISIDEIERFNNNRLEPVQSVTDLDLDGSLMLT